MINRVVGKITSRGFPSPEVQPIKAPGLFSGLVVDIPPSGQDLVAELRNHSNVAFVVEIGEDPYYYRKPQPPQPSKANRCCPSKDAWHRELLTWSRFAPPTLMLVVDHGINPDHPGFEPGQIKELDMYGNIMEEASRPNKGLFQDDLSGLFQHGTFIASRTGGSTVGIVPDHRIISVRTNSYEPENIGPILNTIAKHLHQHPERRAVINMSFQCPQIPESTRILHPTLDRLHKLPVLVVASAGKYGPELAAGQDVPGAHGSVLVVGSIDRAMAEAPISQAGHRVDLLAPGVNVSGVCTQFRDFCLEIRTSNAAPIVCGLALRYLTTSEVDIRSLKGRLVAKADKDERGAKKGGAEKGTAERDPLRGGALRRAP